MGHYLSQRILYLRILKKPFILLDEYLLFTCSRFVRIFTGAFTFCSRFVLVHVLFTFCSHFHWRVHVLFTFCSRFVPPARVHVLFTFCSAGARSRFVHVLFQPAPFLFTFCSPATQKRTWQKCHAFVAILSYRMFC